MEEFMRVEHTDYSGQVLCTGELVNRQTLLDLGNVIWIKENGYPHIKGHDMTLTQKLENLVKAWDAFKIEDPNNFIDSVDSKAKAVEYFLRLSLRQLCIEKHRFKIGETFSEYNQFYKLKKISAKLMYIVETIPAKRTVNIDPVAHELQLSNGQFVI